MAQAASVADSLGCSTVTVVLAGGGANLGFIQDIARRSKPKKVKAKPKLIPTVPSWAHTETFQGQLAPVFSQLAIAMGGAIAPANLVTVHADESAAA
jgi:hypothetical protein